MTEADLLRAVTDLAAILGWQWVHWRPAQTAHGWRTPVQGPLGAGFPDLLLVREKDRRIMFVELKADRGKVSPAQVDVALRLFAAGQDVQVWRPSDLDDGTIQAALA